MVSTVPVPSWSTAPPSSTQSALAKRQAGAARRSARRVLVAVELVLAAPAVEAEAERAPRLARADEIGPVSRSQMSPNGSTITSAKGASAARCLGRVLVRGDQPHLLALAAGVDRLGECRDLPLGRLQIA